MKRVPPAQQWLRSAVAAEVQSVHVDSQQDLVSPLGVRGELQHTLSDPGQRGARTRPENIITKTIFINIISKLSFFFFFLKFNIIKCFCMFLTQKSSQKLKVKSIKIPVSDLPGPE